MPPRRANGQVAYGAGSCASAGLPPATNPRLASTAEAVIGDGIAGA
jgi:hypothetical protein